MARMCYAHLMKMPIRVFRVWRIVKRSPARAMRDWLGVLANEHQFFSLLLAVFTSWLGLQTASLPQVIEEVNAWGNALQAFIYVALGWAAICLIRAPLVVAFEDAQRGKWHGGRFVYHRPHLVATLRCKATGQPQFHRIVIDDAEPNSFVYYSIEVEGDPPRHLYSADLVAEMVLVGLQTQPGRGGQTMGGLRIRKDRSVDLLIVMREDMLSQTVRVFMRDFSVGNLEDQDGDEGEFREAFRRPPEGDGGGRGA